MDKTEFIQLEEFEIAEDENPDDILEAARKNMAEKESESSNSKDDADDLLSQLGL
jgi:hypothetical protein